MSRLLRADRFAVGGGTTVPPPAPDLPHRFHPADAPDPTSLPVRRPGRVVVLFALLSTVSGLLFAWFVPVAWGPDEDAHVYRSYQVSQGRFAPVPVPDDGPYPDYGGAVPSSVKKAVDVCFGPPRDLEVYQEHMHQGYDACPAALDAPVDGPGRSVVGFPHTSAYSPVPYAPAASGMTIGRFLGLSVGATWHLMRVLQVLAYTAVVGVGLWALRRSRFLWAGFVVALIPTALYQSAVVSADSVTNAVVFTFTALVLRATLLRRGEERMGTALFAAMLACAVLLPLMKPTYVVLSLLLLLVPFRSYPEALGRLRPPGHGDPVSAGPGPVLGLRVRRWVHRAARPLTVLGLTLAVTLVGFAGWMGLAAGTTEAMGVLRGPAEQHTVRPADQMRFVLTHPLDVLGIAARTLLVFDWDYASAFFGQMGYGPRGAVTGQRGRLDGPFLGALCTMVALVAVVLLAPRVRERASRTAGLALVLLLNVAAVFGTLYLSFTPVQAGAVHGVQGRYFVPLVLLLLGVLVHLLPVRLRVGPRTPARADVLVVVLCVAAIALALAGYITQVYVPAHPRLP